MHSGWVAVVGTDESLALDHTRGQHLIVGLASRPQLERERRSSVTDWIEGHHDLVALAVVALGFGLRLMSATRLHLHPDEALHYLIAHQTSLAQVYRASLTSAHPPLFFMLLFFWRLPGSSELVLRLISVAAGTAGLWVGYKWLAYRSGPTTGLIGLLLLALCPTLVSLSAEVRSYATLLLVMTLALYCLERGLREKSERMLLWFALALFAANAMHYSAVWFTIAVGLYAVIRIVRERLPGRWTRLWAAIQVGIVALWVFLYLTHIRVLRGSQMEQVASQGWLQAYYFHPGQERLLPFLLRALDDLFASLFSLRIAGLLALGLFLAGVVMLLTRYRRRSGLPTSGPAPRGIEDPSFGVLLIAAFAVNALAALAGLYPFGSWRHSVFLILFVIAGISSLLGRLAGRRLRVVLLAVVIIMSVAWSGVAIADWEYRAAAQAPESMAGAMGYVRDSIPSGSLLFVDCQTANLLGYYLGRDQIDSQTTVLQRRYLGQDQITSQFPAPKDKFTELSYGGYRVVSSPLWNFTAHGFWSELREMKQQYGLGPGTWVWVVDACWGVRGALNWGLAKHYPQHAYRGLRTFGRNISVFQVQEGIQ
jgi:4-amino-4-deoxy-L-arabinose transferase-like glycosyltransferase